MLGAQDPEMMRIRQRQQLLEGADISDPKVLRERATIAMQQNDYPAAQQLASRAMDIEAKQASTAKDLAAANREKAATTPADIAKAQRIAALKAALPVYKAAGDATTIKLLEDELAALEPAEKTPSFGAEAERYSRQFYNKPYSALSSQEMAKVNAKVEEVAVSKTPKYTIAPEIKMAPDIVGAVGAADKATEAEVNMLNSAKLAKQLINETAKSNNSQTWEAARTTIAKAVGENKLSNEDIRRTGVDPRLVQGALDWVNKKIEGVPNADIQKQLFVLGSVLENNAASRYDAKINRFRGAAEAAKFPGNPSTYFPRASERSGGQGTTGNVIEWSSMGSNQKK
jgi:hypothetical protein